MVNSLPTVGGWHMVQTSLVKTKFMSLPFRAWREVADLDGCRHAPPMAAGRYRDFYLAPDNKLMAASVNGKGSSFEVSAVKPLFDVRALEYRRVIALPCPPTAALPYQHGPANEVGTH